MSRLTHSLQAAGLLAVFLIASRDVDRTMSQKPMTPEQVQSFESFLAQRRNQPTPR